MEHEETAAPSLDSALRVALENTTDNVFMLSADWRFTFLNQRAAVQITSGRKLLGQNIWEAFPEAIGAPLWNAYHRCMRERDPTEAEELYRPLGRRFAARAFPAEDGGVTVFFRDVTEERQAAARLLEAEAMLGALGEASPDLLYAKDAQGRVRYANPATLAVVGLSAEQVIGRTDAEYMPDRAQGEAVMRNDERIMRNGCTETVVEVVTDTRRGEPRQWESIKTPLRDPTTGETIGLVGVARDVTDARDAERKLAASEARFRETFEQAAVGFAHVALDGRWLRVNQRLCEMLGYSEEELLARSYQDLTHPDDLEDNGGRVKRMLSGELPVLRMEKRYIRKDGVPLWVNLTASLARDEKGEPRYFISVLQDTSRRRAVEAKLAASETRLQDLVNTLDLASVMVRDPDGTIRFWSAGCERLYGWTAQESVGRISHLLLRTIFPEPLAQIETTLLREGEWSGDVRHRRRDGSELIAAARKVLRRDAAGRPVAIMESLTDVTRLRETEVELRRLNDELADRVRSEVAAREQAQGDLAQAQRLEALGKLAGGIAHDFNNVLQAVSRDRAGARAQTGAAGTGSGRTRRFHHGPAAGIRAAWGSADRDGGGPCVVARIARHATADAGSLDRHSRTARRRHAAVVG